MKKIGMITYRDIADGKGRFLQAFSLYSAIQHLGYDVELIDYYPKNKSIIKESKQNKIMRILKNPNDWPGYLAKLQHDTMLYIYRDQFNTKRTM